MSRDIQAATLSKARQSRWGKTKLITSAVVAMLCLIWLVPWAYVRMTTPPARARDDLGNLVDRLYAPREDDATDEWRAAMTVWPVWPTFTEPPPRGMKWKFESGTAPSVDNSEMSAGPWDPASRPTLRCLIRHISSPPMTTFLKSVTDLRERSWIWESGLGQGPAGIEFRQVRGISRLLVARSRYRQAELNDVHGAWDDLKTVLTLSRTATRNLLIHTLVLNATDSLALSELQHFLREAPIDEGLAADIAETLSALPSFERVWRRAMDTQLQNELDEIGRCFADDGNGNGWLVLGAQPDAEALRSGVWPIPAADRSKLWNLFSFLYHDRRTVEARVRHHWSQRLEAGLQPYTAAVRTLAELDTQPLFGPGDGPWLHTLERKDRVGIKILLQGQVRAIAKRRAVQIMVGLNRFRGERGHYPSRLEYLVPRLLSSLPVDPFCGESFAYKPVGDDAYVLYSCGYDGVDDGGRRRVNQPLSIHWDLVYSNKRNDPYTKEPIAVPLDAEVPASDSSPWK